MSKKARLHLRPALLLSAAITSSVLISCTREAPTSPTGTPIAAVAAKAVADAIYVCPMHPHITSHAPGTCPICGMTLVLKQPATALDAAPSDAPATASVAVSSRVRQTLGIRIAQVQRRDLQPRLRATARVVSEAGGEQRVQSRVEGFIEKLHVSAPGTPVRAGAVIADVYAPELVQAQEEMLLGGDAVAAAAERLRRYGIAERDIEAIRGAGTSSRTLPLRAPVSGIVTAIDVREGGRVGMADVIASIAARGGLRIEVSLFPAQRVLLGTRIEARFTQPGLPETHWRGSDPQWLNVLDPVTQTLGLRLRVDGADDLAIGTVLDADLRGAPRARVLMVPMAAVIRDEAGARVLREDGDGEFVPVEVAIGPRDGDDIEIVSGLAEHDRVVVSGQFLIDSEAQLRAVLPSLDVRRQTAEHRHD